jgi:hypothetical protein
MTSPTSLAITLNACLLFVGAATAVSWNAARAEDSVSRPTEGGGSVQLEPVPPNPQARRTRAIFVCRRAPPVIFSDRPCGQLFEERKLKVEIPQPTVGRVASTSPSPAPAQTRPRVQPAPREETPSAADERCRRLRDQLEKLDDRMRTGYSAREAAKLWNRWRELKSEIDSARC